MNVSFTNDNFDLQIIAKLIGDTAKAGFMSVHNLKTKTGNGEVASYVFCKGISYENAVEKSLQMLSDIEADKGLSVTVKRGVWKDEQGNINPTGRKSKVFSTPSHVTETYKRGDEVLEEAIQGLRNSLENPRPVSKEYESIGNGVYKDESGKVYVRDLRLVSKSTIVEGEKKHKATSAVVAIKDKLSKDFPTSKYRMFNLDGDYEKIKLGGHELTREMKADIDIEEIDTTKVVAEKEKA